MIEFKGEMSGKSKKFLIRKQTKLQFGASLFVLALAIIPAIVGIVNQSLIGWLVLGSCVLFVLFSLIPPGKGSQKLFVPKRLYINLKEETIVHKSETTERFHMLSSVKKVVDYGEWYDFVFFFQDRDMYFVCQQSLLTHGTLEQFEALFEGKIERR